MKKANAPTKQWLIFAALGELLVVIFFAVSFSFIRENWDSALLFGIIAIIALIAAIVCLFVDAQQQTERNVQ